MPHAQLFASIVLAFSLATPALASDWYVDAVNGSNANSGTSPTDAWRSVTWALASTPTTGAQQIHLAPGGYGHSTGEQFPLLLRPQMQLIGAAGGVRSIIGQTAGWPYDRPIVAIVTQAGLPLPPNAQVRIENVDFARGGLGIEVRHDSTDRLTVAIDHAFLRDIDVGIRFVAADASSLDLQLDRVHFQSDSVNGGALWVVAGSIHRSSVTARDCTFIGGLTGAGLSKGIDARFERCRFEGTSFHGVHAGQASGPALNLALESCLIAESNNYGVRYVASPGSSLELKRCTIVDSGYGLMVHNPTAPGSLVEIDQCVFANPVVDLTIPGHAVVRDSLIRSGQLAGVNGNFAADPLFADPASGDWGPRWGSPCIDRIAIAAVASIRDLTGRRRGVDGDLDTIGRSDVGAVEFRPLAAPLAARIGGALKLGSWGPQGAASTIYWARSSPVAPVATPFGQLALPAATMHIFAITSTSSASATLLQRSIPNALALVGQTYSFQALVDTPAAPAGRAYTNVAPVTFGF